MNQEDTVDTTKRVLELIDLKSAECAFHLEGTQFANDLLHGEDFVAAAECQQGFEAGRDSLVVGSNEPLVQHLHRVWDEAVGISPIYGTYMS